MAIQARCPACRAKLAVPEKSAGRTVKCPKCYGPVPVTSGDSGQQPDRKARQAGPTSRPPTSAASGEAPATSIWPRQPQAETPRSPGGLLPTESPSATSAAADDRVGALRDAARSVNPYASPQADDDPVRHESATGLFDPPWEERMGLASLFTTTWAVLIHPLRTFGNLPRDSSWRAAVYYLVVSYLFIGARYSMFYAVEHFGEAVGLSPIGERIWPYWVDAIVFLITPWFVTYVVMLIFAYILHGCLKFTGELGGDFEATFRVTFYCSGAVLLVCLLLLPVDYFLPVGQLINLLVAAIFISIGVSRAHAIAAWRAVFGLFAASVLGGCCSYLGMTMVVNLIYEVAILTF